MKKLLLSLLATPHLAFAHEGHGMATASHWHASDAWGYLALAAALAAAGWMGRKK